MNLFLVYTSFILYVLIGIHVFILNRRETINRLFILICLTLAMWAFSIVMIYVSETAKVADFWMKLSYCGVFPGLCLVIHFSLKLSNLIKLRWFHGLVIYALGVFLLGYHWFVQPLFYGNIIKFKGETFLVHIQDDIAFYLFSVFIVLSITFCFVIILIWGIKTESKREKKQAYIIAVSLLVSILLGALDDALLPRFIKEYFSHGSTIYFLLIWIGGIWFTIINYRFMSINSESVSEEILLNIDEMVVLINRKMEIVKTNTQIINCLDLESMQKISMKDLFPKYQTIENECCNLFQQKGTNFSCRLHLSFHEKSKILIDARFTAIKDRFGDILGICMIGKEVKGMKHIKTHYSLTNREGEILQYIINGNINKEIAGKLGITERTVKMHISNLLGKLQVKNKTRLFAFLKDFDLVPDYASDKLVIL